jgi:site-specific recombinase
MFHGSVDLVLVGIVGVLVLFFFAVFLFLRRTATAFKEGMDQ